VFVSLSFGDTLAITALEGDFSRNFTALEVTGPFSGAEGLSPRENIVTRAAALFRERTGYDKPVRIALEKRIPPGGGLGGGSSDAASALMALNALAETRLGDGELGKIGEKLGSDVPFFLSGGAALVTGRGERVRPLEMPAGQLSVVLINPGFSSGTAAVFTKLDEFRAINYPALKGVLHPCVPINATITDSFGKLFEREGLSGEDLIRSLGENPASWPYVNDFLPVLREDREYGAAYNRIFRDLQELGSDFFGLSGSGSTCFGIFTDRGSAEKAFDALFRSHSFVKLTFFLAHKPVPVLQ
jgi:4-diphosphocytidyl-2-C-methyl-D-erythritol kinase